jgi:curli biogenesis system outer membrane secretion channel CsgG
MLSTSMRLAMVVVACVVLIAAAAGAQGITQPKQAQGGSVIKGAAGTNGSTGDSGLEHCDKPMGAIAVVEPQAHVIAALTRYGLSSRVGLIRMMIQQSNCFIVVKRGVGMQNIMQERMLASSGQARQDSNMGGGQMVAADFILTPAVVFSENNAGGVGGSRGIPGPSRTNGRRGRWRPEVQGSADEHAAR